MIEVLPEVLAAGGYVAGQGLEQLARNGIAQNRVALLGAHAGIEAGPDSRQGLLRRSFAQLAIIGAIAGFTAGETLTPPEAHHAIPPVLAVVADHGFSTAHDGSAKTIDTIARSITSTDQLSVQLTVAHNGSFEPTKIGQLITDRPYGPSSLSAATPVAMGNAFNSSQPAQANVLGTGESRNAGVLVLTDGDPVGEVNTVVAQARQEGNMPVFVANADSSTNTTTRELQQIAAKSGGRYWTAKTDARTVADAIKKAIVPHQTAEKLGGSDRVKWAIVSAALLLAEGLQFFRRKSETAVS